MVDQFVRNWRVNRVIALGEGIRKRQVLLAGLDYSLHSAEYERAEAELRSMEERKQAHLDKLRRP